MANQTLGNVLLDNLSVNNAAESSPYALDGGLVRLRLSGANTVKLRVATGGNDFLIPANVPVELYVPDWAGKSVYFRNDSGSTAVVHIMQFTKTV